MTVLKLPRDLVTILRTESKNQRMPPIDYVITEDGGRMVHRTEPDIAMAELLEEAATALRALLERNTALERERAARDRWFQTHVACGELGMFKRAAEAEARVQELEAENARLRERQAEADRVIDMVEEDPALARSLARSYRDK